MFVANRMTKNPMTVNSDVKIDEAANLMKTRGFRRLPVVDDGKLVGFISDRDIMRVAPSPATTLSKYEINSLLAKIKVSDIMQKNVIAVQADAPIEEAALLMYKNRIGGMPVISSVGAVVGVITETDIFKALVDVMGLAEGKTRLTLEVTDRVGVVKNIATIFAEANISIDSLVTCKENNGKYEIIIRGDIPDVDDIKAQLTQKGYEVIHTVKIG